MSILYLFILCHYAVLWISSQVEQQRTLISRANFQYSWYLGSNSFLCANTPAVCLMPNIYRLYNPILLYTPKQPNNAFLQLQIELKHKLLKVLDWIHKGEKHQKVIVCEICLCLFKDSVLVKGHSVSAVIGFTLVFIISLFYFSPGLLYRHSNMSRSITLNKVLEW